MSDQVPNFLVGDRVRIMQTREMEQSQIGGKVLAGQYGEVVNVAGTGPHQNCRIKVQLSPEPFYIASATLMRAEYDPSHRHAAPDEDDSLLSRIEVNFAIPTWVDSDTLRELCNTIERLCREPKNTPVIGVHWQSGHGARPTWSRADGRFLGIRADEDAPESGEPTFDDSIYQIETSAREDYRATRSAL